MTKVKKVLVFPAGTEIALEIHRALRCSRFVELYGATSLPCHADFVFARCAQGLPYVDDPALIDAINELSERWGIDDIYPAHDSALLQLARARDRLKARLVCSPLETVELCRDKSKTYDFLAGADYLPRVFHEEPRPEDFPVFIKPAVGQGAQGARRVDSLEELRRCLAGEELYTVSEYLPGEEITVDCFSDRHGALRLVSPRSRERIRAGIAVRSRLLPRDEAVERIARDLHSRLVFRGAWFFQLKRAADGSFRLMEAAPRVAGTMGLTRNRGANLPLLSLYDHWDMDVELLQNEGELLLDRAFVSRFRSSVEYDTVVVDFDDSLILRGKVNGELMMLLYQARNAGKRLVLLTRHSTDIYEDLKKYRIAEGLFDEIIVISDGESKSRYVRPGAIFIDDSFAERRRVKEESGVPVFDLDMVESLLDERV